MCHHIYRTKIWWLTAGVIILRNFATLIDQRYMNKFLCFVVACLAIADYETFVIFENPFEYILWIYFHFGLKLRLLHTVTYNERCLPNAKLSSICVFLINVYVWIIGYLFSLIKRWQRITKNLSYYKIDLYVDVDNNKLHINKTCGVSLIFVF